MPVPATTLSSVTRPGSVVFPENQEPVQVLARSAATLVTSPHPAGTVWHRPAASPTGGLRLLVTATGHAILYGEHGQRILYIDPGGTPLHECAWRAASGGPAELLYARMRLDWGQWVGLKPEGLVNEARFDISRKPGWQRLTARDLQAMAAQALRVTPEEIAFFYDDNSLALDQKGQVTIRHRKDAFYILEDGTFSRPRFMACMGAMHWGRIDFLPVVELFQSLLAGTGSATFELIRGLYDDQAAGVPSRLLRYRGIPTYPSLQAFQLFSTCFVPEAPGGDPLALFMDPARSAEVAWRLRPDAPHRYFDTDQGLCVTVTAGAVTKVTKRDDSAALPFGRPRKDGFAPGGRMVGTTTMALQLQDGDRREELPLRPEWGVTKHTPLPALSASPHGTWRALFPDGAPALDMKRAYFAVPLYPDDDQPVADAMTQPLALEHVLEYLERLPGAPGRSGPPGGVLIHGWDLLLSEFIDCADGRGYTVLYAHPEFAQRQAQRLADQASAAGHLASLQRIAFLPADRHQDAAYARSYGMIYRWMSFDRYNQRADCEQSLAMLSKALVPGGFAVLAGPPWLGEACPRVSLRLLGSDPIAGTAGVRMHQAILPKARINPEATLFLLQKT